MSPAYFFQSLCLRKIYYSVVGRKTGNMKTVNERNNFCIPGFIATMMLSLRRTLVRFVRYLAFFSQRSQRDYERNDLMKLWFLCVRCVKS